MGKPSKHQKSKRHLKPTRHAPRKSRRFGWGWVLVLALVGGWWFWHSSPLPKPLPVNTAGLDPAIAELIDETTRHVLASPRSGAAWGALGSVLLHYEFQPQAAFAFQQAESFSPKDPRWPYLHGLLLADEHSDRVLAKFQAAVDRCQDRPDMPRLRLAQLLLERGQLGPAENEFQTLLRQQTKHPLALLGLARIRLAQGRPAECTNYLAQCATNPYAAKSAQALLAQAQQQLGQPKAAETAARQSANLPPDRLWPDPFWSEALRYRVGKKARIDQAVGLMDQQRMAEALQVLNTVTNEYPADPEAWYFIGWILNQDLHGAEAEPLLREHLRLSPNSPKGLAQLAAALLGQERYAEAVPVLQQALQLKPTWSDLHFNMGYACAHLGNNQGAIHHFRQTLLHNPNYLDAYIVLADLLHRSGNSEEAIQRLRQALALNPGDERATFLLQQIQETQ